MFISFNFSYMDTSCILTQIELINLELFYIIYSATSTHVRKVLININETSLR